MQRSAIVNCSDSDETGKTGLFMVMISSHPDWRDVDPALLAPARERAFGQLHALGAFQQRVFIRRVLADVANEHFPLFFEAVVVRAVFWELLPVGIEIVVALLVRI